MRRIVILATYVGVVNRGAETFVIELVKKLKKNYNIEVYSLGVDSSIKNNIIPVDLKLPFWFKLNNYFFTKLHIYKTFCHYTGFPVPDSIEQFYFTKKVYNKFLKGRTDIDLMFPNNGVHGAKISKRIRDKHNTPYIYTGHGGIGKSEKVILDQKPNTYIALNETHKNWALKFYNKITKIHNGVDTKSFQPKTLQISKKDKTVLCVGALVDLKRQELLIDAVSLLNDVNLILLGAGPLHDKLHEYGKLKLNDRFEIKSVAYEEIYKFYNEADLFSLATKSEPFGIVYLEAMAMNKPIVAPDDASRREIIGNAGLFCNVENALDYANTIQQALNADWGSIPRERAVSNFDWNIIAEKYNFEIDYIINSSDKSI